MGRQSRLAEVHGSVQGRSERGKAARKRVPRSSHAGFCVDAHRRDPVAVLEDQAATRVPDLVPIRYGRMAASPFAFFRGAAAVMAMDLATTPTSGLVAQVCGDAHLANFGVFNSPERRLIFDVNDFDETLPGPWEWDLKRLVASLAIAGRGNGFGESATIDIVRESVMSYRMAMTSFAGMTNLDVWYARLEVSEIIEGLRGQLPEERVSRLERTTARSSSRDNAQAMSRLTVEVEGVPRFISQPPLVVPIAEFADGQGDEWARRESQRVLGDYRATLEDDRRHVVSQYEYVDLARKVVGVGSVGTRAWIVLLLGRDTRDPLVLQFKEAQASVLEAHVGSSEFSRSGHRVVAGQRLMQAASDIFLGWFRGVGLDGHERDFYVRQLRDGKGSVDIESMRPRGMGIYGRMCAWTLARAHARSGDRIAIASYLGNSRIFDDAIVEFAIAYADQNDRDHVALLAAIDSGRVRATLGV
ncbi:unannotated protein [freshwater metagenome]|uniref:Unannotated protein n=1 Tax=freshwater metagenome TaxID=449393 RepID=A0A6J7S5Z0_9ZZZZ|nr:DUF2252 domain-containing protein [Actinomycetota bacterium]MSW36817.1 DUF2252 domain-containing protein [Actinomycetota bacterium]